jgi:hypothetical protein
MLRKTALALGILGALMLPSEAFAKHGGGHGGHGHGHHGGHGHGHWHGHKNWHGHGNWHGRQWRGHGRYWHSRWWGYGVGPCWRLVPGGWIWVCY